MKRLFLTVGAGVVISATAVGAQGGGATTTPCPAGTTVLGIPDQNRASQDACTQAFDLYQFMAPQLGLALAGGNATLGQGGALGGPGRFSIGVRANLFKALVPDVAQFTQSTTGARQQQLPTNTQFLGFPTADAAIGLFKGVPLGLTNVGGLDLLLSASYVPEFTTENVSVTPERSWQLGYGARLGILQESLISPGVSLTYLKRDLPKTSIIGTTGADSLRVLNATVNTAAWRIVASKSLIAFGIAAGVGQDMYDQSARIEAAVHTTIGGFPVNGTGTIPETSQSLTRTNYFLDLSLNMPMFKVVGEVGQVRGGTVNTYNSFSGGRADRAQAYWSIGVRLAR